MPVLVKQLTSKLGYALMPCGNTRQENFVQFSLKAQNDIVVKMPACYILPETEPLITRAYSFNFSVVLEVSIQCDFVITNFKCNTSLMKVT